MSPFHKQQTEDVVVNLSALIFQTALSVGNEQDGSGNGADVSDDLIKTGCERLAKLRQIREDFENEMSGVLL